MRNAVRHLFIVVLSLLLGAHFLRWGNAGLALTCVAFPLLLVFRRRWCAYVLSLFLLAGAARWFWLTDLLVAQRAAMGAPWGRLALILGGIATACVHGAWDNSSASARRPRNARPFTAVRAGIFVLVLATAFALRRLGVGAVEANVLGAAFGIVGVGVMGVASRRLGYMVHCTSYCPIGLASTTIGRINPFRVRIDDGCDECRACSRSCRYAALNIEHIRRRRPGITCTLCGDCLGACNKRQIRYCFPELTAEQARTVFLVLVAVLHAVFLGVARI